MNIGKIALNVGMMVLFVALNSYGTAIIKYQVNNAGMVHFSSISSIITFFTKLITSPLVISGLTSLFISSLVIMLALSRMDLSIAYPLAIGLNFITIILISVFMLGESVTTTKIFAISLILFSIFLFSRS